jgi:GAF domain-containing protein
MALPLIARDKAIGALTIQSEQSEAFSPEDIVSLQGMADLIAVALDNARLYREAQQALSEVSTVHRSYLSQAWETFARNRMDYENRPPTYSFDDNTFKRGEAVTLPRLDQAINERKPVVSEDGSDGTITIPIRLRDQVIGAIAIESESPDRAWDRDEIALIEAVIEQTALSLENARLIEETETALAESRRLAGRERTVNTISSKIRRLPNVESVLTTALIEVGRVLGANKGQVRLGTLTRRTTLPEGDNE